MWWSFMFDKINVLSFRGKTPESRDPMYEMTIHNIRTHPGVEGNVNEGYESPTNTPDGQNLGHSYASVDDNPHITHSYMTSFNIGNMNEADLGFEIHPQATSGGQNLEYSYAYSTLKGAS